MQQAKLKVLFFSPHAYIWQHAFPEALVVKSLQDAGHEVVYIGCDGVLSDGVCVSMRVAAADFDSDLERKKYICNNCVQNKNRLTGYMAPNYASLSDFLTKTDFDKIDSELNIIDKNNFLSYAFDGMPLGKVAVYETMMQFKKNSFDFSDKEFETYKAWLRNSILVAIAAKKLLLRYSPDRLLMYNSLYSVNNTFGVVAKGFSIPSYGVHAWDNFGEFYQGLTVTIGHNMNYLYGTAKLWEEYKYIPVSKTSIELVKSHMASLLGSKTVFTYSSPVAKKKVDIRSYFGIPDNSKIAIALMSSYDEVYAAYAVGAYTTHEAKLYKNQVSWLKDLIDFFSKREDLFLIIRVHPREFPNRREGRKSENATVYEEMLSNLPSNIKANLPSDGLSIYDLAPDINLVLNGFSSAGLEMSLLGLPVLSYAHEWNIYPIDLDCFVNDRDEYLDAIVRLIVSGWSADKVKMACRWLAFKFAYTVFYIGDSFAYKQGEKINQDGDMPNLQKDISAKDKIVKFICSGEPIFVDKEVIASISIDYDCENIIIKDFIRTMHDSLFGQDVLDMSMLGQQIRAYLESDI